MFLFSSPCHPHHGSGHHSQCSLQLPQQVPAHHYDVKQRRYNARAHAYISKVHTVQFFLLVKKKNTHCFFSPTQFVEIKGSVFKKFEKNNLFQMSNSGKW